MPGTPAKARDRQKLIKLIEEEINDLIDDWHAGMGEGKTLAQYLGITEAEYAEFVRDPTQYISHFFIN